MNGILIALEGIDGSGKSTLASCLVNKLEEDGYQARKIMMRELEEEDIFQKVIHGYQLDPKSPAYMFFSRLFMHLKWTV